MGLTPDLLPSLAAGTPPVVTPPQTPHALRRKPSCTQAEGGPRSQLGGWAPPVAKTMSGSEESIWSRRGLWAPSQPSCLNPPAVPRGGRQAWGSGFPGVVPGPLGKGAEKALPHLRGGWVGVRTLQSWEEEVAPGIWVVFCRPFPSSKTTALIPPRGAWPLGALGALPGEGPGAGCPARGRVCTAPVPLGLHTAPHFRSPPARPPGQGAASPAAAGSL